MSFCPSSIPTGRRRLAPGGALREERETLGRQLLCKLQDTAGMGERWPAELENVMLPTAKLMRFAFKAPVCVG